MKGVCHHRRRLRIPNHLHLLQHLKNKKKGLILTMPGGMVPLSIHQQASFGKVGLLVLSMVMEKCMYQPDDCPKLPVGESRYKTFVSDNEVETFRKKVAQERRRQRSTSASQG
jgi:hypothetical protein